MQRRQLLGAGLAMAGASALPAGLARAAPVARVRPGAPGWPSDADWAGLNKAVGGRLSPVAMPDLKGPDAAKLLANPYYIGDTPALTESSGWLDAWRSQPSAYMVDATSAADVAAAVRFAGAHNLRLVIKGRGHSYLGGSNAPDSLLIWTRHMDDVTVHEAFTPAGSSAAPVPAVSCGAGAMWMHAYKAVTVEGGRYVQGGGCSTVGVAGLVQGGGFGSFSKGFGTAGASLIEAEVVTADGKLRVVNHVQDPDLYWALKGGGGGTFGAITRLTLATHPLPENFGAINLTIHAKSNDAFRRLLARFVELVRANLMGPHFGEQVRTLPTNSLVISMVFQGLPQADARAAFQPLVDFANASPADYEGQNQFIAAALPARQFWDAGFMKQVPGAIRPDARPEATLGDYWWSGDGEQVGVFWHAYTSAWLPASLLEPANQSRLVDAWFAASRHWGVSFHFNKGLAGAPPEAIAASRDTATNPDALTAFALAIIADGGPSLFAGAKVDPNAQVRSNAVHASMKALLACAPGAGSYVNETDYFQPDWQRAFWGDHYPRLLRIKRRYDPSGLFTVHHGAGSEGWSADGFTRAG
jgi:FAD/FMN-containing dehydrogenase